MWNCLLQNMQSISNQVTKMESSLRLFLQALEHQTYPDISTRVLFAFDDPIIKKQSRFRSEPSPVAHFAQADNHAVLLFRNVEPPFEIEFFFRVQSIRQIKEQQPSIIPMEESSARIVQFENDAQRESVAKL